MPYARLARFRILNTVRWKSVVNGVLLSAGVEGGLQVTSTVRRHQARTVVVGLAAFLVVGSVLVFPARSRGADADAQPSSNVAVIPGFVPKAYPGHVGVPMLPVGNSRLSAYRFTQLPVNEVTPTKLLPYDTVILYGIRWADIPAAGQTAINAFAATHKVLIWDADNTGAQNYSTFIHPFSDAASDRNVAGEGSVVSFPGGDFLASDQPSSPNYLDPKQLVSDLHEVNDMNAMTPGTKDWVPALFAANRSIPGGGWLLAWSYGVIGDHTGLTVYSGIDADAFGETSLSPNYAIKELALQLGAPFRQTADTSCAPNCQLPSSSGGGSGGSGGSGGGSGGSGGSGGGGTTHAACGFAKRVPAHWVHGRVSIWLKASVAEGITGRVLSQSGRVLASGREVGNLIHLRVTTKPLPSNRASRLRAVVYLGGQQACLASFQLKVDNTPPRLLRFLRRTTGTHMHLVSFRVSETSQMRIVGGGSKYRRWVPIAARRLINVRLSGHVRHASLILRDRAGNTVTRTLRW